MFSCAGPTCGMPMGAYGGYGYPPPAMSLGYDQGVPQISAGPGVGDYYSPMGPMSVPIPSAPPAEDIIW